MSLTDDITDPRLAKALAHPLRLEILRHLGDRTASPSEIASEIGAPLTNVSYHVRKLRALGLIKLVRKTPKRGVVEHYYSAKPRRQVSDEAWDGTPDIVKDALLAHSTERALSELVRSSQSGGFKRKEAHWSMHQMKLDERGWKEVAEVLHKALEDVERLEEKAIARMKADSGSESVAATSMIFLFETAEAESKPTAGRKPRVRSTA